MKIIPWLVAAALGWLLAVLLWGCASKPPTPAPKPVAAVPAALMPPPVSALKRPVPAIIFPPPPAKTNVLLSWDYPDGSNHLTAVFFKKDVMADWQHVTNVWGTNFLDQIQPLPAPLSIFPAGGTPILTAIGFYRVANAAGTVELAWEPSVSTNVVGYKIYYGQTPQTYTNTLTVGNVTNCFVTGLPPGTNYFSATAVDALGLESQFSNEAAWAAATNPPAPLNFRLQAR